MMLIAALSVTIASMLSPVAAYASSSGFSLSNNNLTQDLKDSNFYVENDLTPSTLTSVGHTLINTLLFIAIGIFVLRIALTAFDRIVFSNLGGSMPAILESIPAIGPYPDPSRGSAESQNTLMNNSSSLRRGFVSYGIPVQRDTKKVWTWAAIWKNFALQLAIAGGVWILASLLLGVLGSVFGVIAAS